ncbi:hypothetical protein TNCV_4537271 [Trichonephila clavipes]|nr:hypothetical protein TNCV_4537271 [Trichonephila clavipes]
MVREGNWNAAAMDARRDGSFSGSSRIELLEVIELFSSPFFSHPSSKRKENSFGATVVAARIIPALSINCTG